MENALILTLGHGSSAVLIVDGEIKCGYQLERITGVKGDSRFPALAIEEIEKYYLIPLNVTIMISHWHPSGDVDRMAEKHWNRAYLANKFPTAEFVSTNQHTTHHDTHALSAIAYNHSIKEDSHIIVADGFGTFGETLSLYRYTKDGLNLRFRSFGFSTSLGLLYQYATDYVGWKQNQDEWKLNACANQIEPERMMVLEKLADEHAGVILQTMAHRSLGEDDPITSLGALSFAHKEVVDLLSNHFPADDKPGIAFFLQKVVYFVLRQFIVSYQITDCTFVGGCFLNVQLNGELGELLQRICVMPLSGDEGAGLGIYRYFNPEFIIPDDLCWGRRSFDERPIPFSPSIIYSVDIAETVIEHLDKGHIVNVVRGTMEFGPRAYCNTSTLAFPTVKNRQYINMLNNRFEGMPMCPVVDIDQYQKIQDSRPHIVRSVEHMILAVPIDPRFQEVYPGIEYTTAEGVTTCRPQVVDSDHWMKVVLEETGPLINTSFNNHGSPIVYTLKQVHDAHEYMKARDYNKRVVTIIDISQTNRSASGKF